MLNKVDGNLLFDFYGSLLTEHQNDILNDYYNEDLSMAEIAENNNVSKSAVSDIVKRSLLQLQEYEDKLNLIKQTKSLDNIIDRMEKDEIPAKYIKELKKISRG